MVFHSIESFQEAVVHTLGSIARHGINGNIVDAAEDAVFDIGIVALQAAEQDLDLLPLGTTAAVVAHGAVLSKAAGTLDEDVYKRQARYHHGNAHAADRAYRL